MKNVYMVNCTRVDNELFFVSSERNILYSMDLNNKEIRILEEYPDEEDYDQPALFGNILSYNHKLILVPLVAKKLWIYDLINRCWDSILFDEDISSVVYKFFGSFIHNQYIYLLGHYYKGIVRVDIENKTIRKIDMDLRENRKNDGFFFWDFIIKNNHCILPSLSSNQIVDFDFKTNQTRYIDIGGRNNQYVGITWDGKYYWLSPRRNGKYVRWDGMEEVIEYELPSCFDTDDYCFIGAYMNGDEVVFPGMLGKFGTISFSKDKPYDVCVRNKSILTYKRIDDLFIQQDDNSDIFIFNGKDKCTVHPMINKDNENRIRKERMIIKYKRLLNTHNIIKENEHDSILFLAKALS